MDGSSASTGGDAAEKAEVEPAVTTSTPHADILKIMSSLPAGQGYPPYTTMHLYGGFWLPSPLLASLAAVHARFKPRPTDVLLASFPKSGTTWLKALAFSALNRAAHSPSSGGHHPLHRSSPHDLVSFLENGNKLDLAGEEEELYGEHLSPRLLATHLPYSLLPHGITADGGSDCKIVYVCRDPKDTLVSLWHFYHKIIAAMQPDRRNTQTFEEAFEHFCEGRVISGPQWRHALEFWEASCRRPEQALFLRYEDMLCDPAGNLRTLSAFMGSPFSPEEEAAGVVSAVVELCSLGKLKGLEVNKGGTTLHGLKNEAFFRNGVVGDWSSCMTPAMAARLDGIVEEALKGSTLTFGSSNN